MTIANGRVRAAKNGGNPRVFKNITTLTPGALYRLTGNCYQGTADGAMIVRVSTSDGIPDGTLGQNTVDFAFDFSFNAPAASVYIGMVAVANGLNGTYHEIGVSMSLVPA